ncbi:hypothetical protein ABBQ38_005070 [Trebouxia sp. C0009 RCD-2024]
MWQDLPADIDLLADADELGNLWEALYEADLSNELAPDAADLSVCSGWVQASSMFDLHVIDPFFDVAKESTAVPEDMACHCSPLAGLVQATMLLPWVTG